MGGWKRIPGIVSQPRRGGKNFPDPVKIPTVLNAGDADFASKECRRPLLPRAAQRSTRACSKSSGVPPSGGIRQSQKFRQYRLNRLDSSVWPFYRSVKGMTPPCCFVRFFCHSSRKWVASGGLVITQIYVGRRNRRRASIGARAGLKGRH